MKHFPVSYTHEPHTWMKVLISNLQNILPKLKCYISWVLGSKLFVGLWFWRTIFGGKWNSPQLFVFNGFLLMVPIELARKHFPVVLHSVDFVIAAKQIDKFEVRWKINRQESNYVQVCNLKLCLISYRTPSKWMPT